MQTPNVGGASDWSRNSETGFVPKTNGKLTSRCNASRISPGAKFLTVNTDLLVFVDFREGGFEFIPSLSYIWAGYHAKTIVEAARQGSKSECLISVIRFES